MRLKTIQQELKSKHVSLNKATDVAQIVHRTEIEVCIWHYARLTVRARTEEKGAITLQLVDSVFIRQTRRVLFMSRVNWSAAVQQPWQPARLFARFGFL